MRIIKWLRYLLIAAISLVALLFGIQNHQSVELVFLFWKTPALGVQVWLGLAFLLGLLASLLLVRRS